MPKLSKIKNDGEFHFKEYKNGKWKTVKNNTLKIYDLDLNVVKIIFPKKEKIKVFGEIESKGIKLYYLGSEKYIKKTDLK